MDFDFNEPALPGFNYGKVFDHVLAEAMPRTLADLSHLVKEFNDQITGLPMPLKPTRLDPDRKHWAIGAFSEEIQEFHDSNNLQDETDALLDLIYFALGRLIEMGIPIRACFEVIQGANMLKVRGELSKRPGSKGHDAVKPEGWTAPDFSEFLLGITAEEFRFILFARRMRASVLRPSIVNDTPPEPQRFEMNNEYLSPQFKLLTQPLPWGKTIGTDATLVNIDDVDVSKMSGVTEIVLTDGRTGETTTRRVHRDENGNSTAPSKED